MENGEECIRIPVYPEMKERVPDACKGSIPYYGFVCAEATNSVQAYLKERKERFGTLKLEEPLFCSDWTLWKTEERALRRTAPQTINKIIKTAARRAGLEQWEHISAHCLRKAFELALEDRVQAGIQHHEHGLTIRLSSLTLQHLCDRIERGVEVLQRSGHPPVLLVSPEIRAAVRQATAARLPGLAVLSYDEITLDTIVESVRMVRDPMAVAA